MNQLDELRLCEFLETIQESQFDRTSADPEPWRFSDVVPRAFKDICGDETLVQIRSLRGTPRDVQSRMRIKTTRYYAQLASWSLACRKIVVPDAAETLDLVGFSRPVDQASHSPEPGVARIYPEIVRFHVVNTCSAHCRFCNQHDAISNPEGPRVGPRQAEVFLRGLIARSPGEPAPREALLSGGDPLVLSNRVIAEYLLRLSDCGLSTVRIATKELAFFPERFDGNFFRMIDAVHERRPGLHISIMSHFNHPDELAKPEPGVSKGPVLRRQIHHELGAAVTGLTGRPFVSVYNQSPVIRGVNDDAAALAELQIVLTHLKIQPLYFFQCRPIPGYHRWAVPVEEAARLVTASQSFLSGRESTARFVMSTAIGKVEVVGVPGARPGRPDGSDTAEFRVQRSDADQKGLRIRARSNPGALWLSDYADRLVSDETGRLAELGPEL